MGEGCEMANNSFFALPGCEGVEEWCVARSEMGMVGRRKTVDEVFDVAERF